MSLTVSTKLNWFLSSPTASSLAFQVLDKNGKLAVPIIVFCGGYSKDAGGDSEGIYALELGVDGKLRNLGLVAEAKSASFLACHSNMNIMYAVEEFAAKLKFFEVNGSIKEAQFHKQGNYDGVPYSFIDKSENGGIPLANIPCHIAVSPNGKTMIVSSWGEGKLQLLTIDREGIPNLAYTTLPQKRLDAAEQTQSRAHASMYLSNNEVISTEWGLDKIVFWKIIDNELIFDYEILLETGKGPRHIRELKPGVLAIICEHSLEVIILCKSEGGKYFIEDIFYAKALAKRQGDTAAEISWSAATKSLYVGIRGSNVISVHGIGAANGSASAHPKSTVLNHTGRDNPKHGLSIGKSVPTTDITSGGKTPRFHVLASNFLLVANQESGEVVSYARNVITGAIGSEIAREKVPAVAFMLLPKS